MRFILALVLSCGISAGQLFPVTVPVPLTANKPIAPAPTKQVVATVANSQVGGTSITAAGTLNLQAGDLAWVITNFPGGKTVSSITVGLDTCTQISTAITGAWSGNIIWRCQDANATAELAASCTVNLTADSAGPFGIVCIQMRGVTTLDTSAIANNGSSLVTSQATAAFTTAQASEILVNAIACDRAVSAFTAGACGSGTCVLGANSTYMGSQSIIFSSLQTAQTASMSWTSTCGVVSVADIFK